MGCKLWMVYGVFPPPPQIFCLENRILPSKLLLFILKKYFSFQMIFCVGVKRKSVLLNSYSKQFTTGQCGMGHNFFLCRLIILGKVRKPQLHSLHHFIQKCNRGADMNPPPPHPGKVKLVNWVCLWIFEEFSIQ